MAESQKGSLSVVNSKEKKSLRGDMDFGKDFFTSWNSMNVTGDDAMDFGFGTVAKGKKKAFSFDKLDMDFSLDGDLDKISLFKVDMSDLDISSLLKKLGTRERSKVDSGDGNHQRKQDRSSFQFDFNELDAFQFEPSFTKEGNKVSKNRDSEEASNKGDCQDSRTDQRDILGASDSLNSNLSASEDMTISKVKITTGDLGKFNLDHCCSLDTKAKETSKPPTNKKSVETAEGVTLPEMMSDSLPQEIVQDTSCQEERAFPRSSAQESTVDFSDKSVSGDQATQVMYSEIQAEVSSRAKKDAVGKQNSKRESVASPELERSLLEKEEKSKTQLCGDVSERNIFGDNDSILIANKDGSKPAQGDADSADTSSSNTSKKSTSVTESSREHQNGKSEAQVASTNSETSKLVERKEKETGSVRSKFFKGSNERESQFQQRQASQTALAMFPAKLMGSKQQIERRRDFAVSKGAKGGNKVVRISDSVFGEMKKSDGDPESARTVGLKDIGENLNVDGLLNGTKSAGFSRLSDKEKTIGDASVSKEAQDENKVVRISDSFSGEMTENNGEPESARTVRGLKDIGKSLYADGLLNGSKSAGSSWVSDKEITIGEPVRGLEKNAKNLVTLRSSSIKSPTPIEQISKPTSQSHATSKTILSTVPIKSSLNVSGEGNKASTPKARSLPDLSGLKISRAVGVSNCPSNSGVQKQTNISRNLMQIKELKGSSSSKISPSISRGTQSRASPSLKRKTYEASNVDTPNIKPLKRFLPSPTESRNIKELSEDAKKEVQNNVNRTESHNNDSCQLPTLDIAREMNLTNLKMPLVIESDDNVEKAEAYAKDLEDMCNMLKKKHEEAKELLVRAVVNNNHLLMLNHPIYEEKIRKIQKFSVQLMSKEVHA